MNIIEKDINELIPYEKNPRKNDDAVEYVANSIKEFGFKVPIIIDSSNVIIAGHTRLKAAQMLELETVPCIVADDLTEEQIKAFRLADNKVSEFSQWDVELLSEELSDLLNIEMDIFGFENITEVDIDSFFQDNTKEKAEKEDEEIQCPHCKMWFKK